MSASRNALFSAALLVGLGAGCTCGIFDPATTRFLCTTDADCADGFTCQTAGTAKECVAAGTGGTNGSTCAGASDCTSGFCVEGVCCESSCGGECQTCGLSSSRGRCVAKAGGTICNSDYVCDGQTGTCPSSCTNVAQCTSARDCVSGSCVDINECGLGASCASNNTCTDTPGSWECSCATGYTGAPVTGGPATCTDVDECASSPDCGPLAVCANIPGTYECRCPSGTFGATATGGPTSCSTVDRCTLPGMCGANATCASTATSYSCTCNAGYSGAVTMGGPATCTDTDECSTPTTSCGPNTNCNNTTGSFQCTCAAGYMGTATTGMAATCTDVDECPGRNCGTNAHCTNTPGSFSCSCDSGFMGTAVTGGPAVCAMVDACLGVNCGANATCAAQPVGGGYTCSCSAGYSGTAVTNGPATCTDIDECVSPSFSCGANAMCTNTPAGSYTCTCAAGYTGATTMGTPATCISGPTELGTAQGPTPQLIFLNQPVAAGAKIVLVVISTNSVTVSDSRSNTWTRTVFDSSCAGCGTVSLYTATLVNPWILGDTVTISASGGSPVGAWLSSLTGFPFFDLSGTYSGNGSVLFPTVSTSGSVTDPDEFLIAAFSTRTANTLTSDAGFTTELAPTDPQLSGIIATKIGTGLMGTQSYTANANPAERFSGFIATFYGGMQTPPTNLSLSHTPNNRSFTVSWIAGRGNGGGTGCAVQYRNPASSWVTIQNTSCDTDAVARSVSLPAGANWFTSAWSSVQVRVIRNSDQVVLGTFPTNLTCVNRAASSTPTPTVDENCDSTWDDHTCSSFSWAKGTVYSNTFTACTNSGDTTSLKVCNATNEAETRYTEGQGNISPAGAFSSSQFGSGCMGPYTGATEWNCTGSNCSYR